MVYQIPEKLFADFIQQAVVLGLVCGLTFGILFSLAASVGSDLTALFYRRLRSRTLRALGWDTARPEPFRPQPPWEGDNKL